MDAEAERGVAVLLAVDDDLVGVARTSSGSRLAAGNGSSTHSSFFIGQPWKLVVLGDQAGHRDRRVGAQELLDRGRHQLGLVGAGAARSSGCWARCHSDEPIALHVVSMPAISSSTIDAAHVLGAERLAVDLDVEQVRR